nr:bifunctional PIG-L family deacetylase/class I SAM-dependent methyltransferase [Cellulosimicrobium sp. CUA-896]
MVSFDHREPGTSEDAWAAAGICERPRPLDLDGVDALVVLAAHPDDESLGAGGLVHRVGERGLPVTVVVATDGEGSHPGSSTPPATLRAVRRREVVAAVGELCPAVRVVLLGLPDGGLREHRAALERGVAAALDLTGGDRPLLCTPWRGDGHRDHRVAGEVAAAVADARGVRLVEYPLWLWHWGDPAGDDVPWDDLRGLALSAAEAAAKEKAVAAHASQVRPLSDRAGDEAVVGPEMLRNAARPVEVLVEAPAPRDRPTDDGTRGARPGGSLGRDFFDRFYTGRDDPWGFESRWYEERKRAVLLASLPRRRFRCALELGCSTGVLTSGLAARCDRVTGVDVAEAPLAAARHRLGPDATLLRLDTPRDWPDGAFDLVVLSEVLYYYDRADLDRALDRVLGSLTDDGVVVACHWRHDVPEYPLGGDEVAGRVRARPELGVVAHHEEEDFVLDVLARRPCRPWRARRGSCERRAAARGARRRARARRGGAAARVPGLRAARGRASRHRASGPRAPRDGRPRRVHRRERRRRARGRPARARHAARRRGRGPVARRRRRGADAPGRGRSREAPSRGRRADLARVHRRRLRGARALARPARRARRGGRDVVVGTVRPRIEELSPDRAAAWLASHEPGTANGHVHGANLGVRLSVYRAAGGFAPVPEHEDVALVDAARRTGARVVADAEAEVLTSARLVGRTPGGYARHLRDDLVEADVAAGPTSR